MQNTPVTNRVSLKKFILTAITAAISLVGSNAAAQSGYYANAYRVAPAAMPSAAYSYGYRPAPRPVFYPQQARPMPAPQAAMRSNLLSFNGMYAFAPDYMPTPVRAAVHAGNLIQNKPYVRGGGHSRIEDSSYDCSGSASYLLIRAGLLSRPLSSVEFASYGEAGPGRYITLYVKAGEHVFMSVCGLRLDTTGGAEGQGPRWRATARSMKGFTLRHPFGL
jgi:hypothetical protein